MADSIGGLFILTRARSWESEFWVPIIMVFCSYACLIRKSTIKYVYQLCSPLPRLPSIQGGSLQGFRVNCRPQFKDDNDVALTNLE